MSNQLTNAVSVSNGKVTTTSLKVAEIFGKRHDHVLRDIETLKIPKEWRLSNFGETQIDRKTPTGGIVKSKAFTITRDGFTLLAMGFTGAKAMQFKIAYIEAFNAMERELQKLSKMTQPELPLSETPETPDVAALLKMKYRGVPVIPNADLAAMLGLTTRQLAHVKSRNNIYTEGLDVFSVGIPKKLKLSIRRAGFASSASRTLLWTESGIRKLLQMLGASKTPYKPLPCSAPVPAKAPETPMIPGLALRKTEKTEERIYNFRLENLLNLDGLPKLRKLLGALHRAGYDVANEFAELSFVENVAHRMAEWQKLFERTLAFNLADVRMLGRTRYVSKVTMRNGEFAKSESGFEGDIPKMEMPL